MDRSTLITIVILWTACALKLSEANVGGCSPTACTSQAQCTHPNKICCGGYCKRCFCGRTTECMCNATSGSPYCVCEDDRTGDYCECSGSGCTCNDIYGLGSNCTEYSNDYKLFANRKFDEQGNQAPSQTYSVMDIDECKSKCQVDGCTLISWKRTGSNNNNCEVYQLVSFVTDSGKVRDNNNWDTYARICKTCVEL